MSENLKQLHSKVDKFYSNGYLQTWCGSVREEWTEFLDRIFSIIGQLASLSGVTLVIFPLADDINKVFAKVSKKISRVTMERFVTN